MNRWICKDCTTQPCYVISDRSESPSKCWCSCGAARSWEALENPVKSPRNYTVYLCDMCGSTCYNIEFKSSDRGNLCCIFNGSAACNWRIQNE